MHLRVTCLQARVRAFRRPPCRAEQGEFPGRVEAGIVDRLRRIEAGNGPNGQRAVLALPTLVHTGASRNRGQLPASGAVSPRARLVAPCGGLTALELLRQCGIRSDERRVGKEWVSTGRSRGAP